MPISRQRYGGSRRRRYATRRTTRKRRYVTRRRVSRRSRKMPRRRILDVTTRKCRDTMLSYTNVDELNPAGAGLGAIQAKDMVGGTGTFYSSIWIPTARPAVENTGVKGAPLSPLRHRSEIFAKGVKENILFETSTARPWRWRRICFWAKGDVIYGDATDPATSQFFRFDDTVGMVRSSNAIGSGFPGEYIFKGTENIDWLDRMTAPVDTDHIKPVYDKTVTLRSGNDAGMSQTIKMWHPMNKTIVYNDEERGFQVIPTALSTSGRRGAGDFYIYDLFQVATGSTETDILRFQPNATFYWHEK